MVVNGKAVDSAAAGARVLWHSGVLPADVILLPVLVLLLSILPHCRMICIRRIGSILGYHITAKLEH